MSIVKNSFRQGMDIQEDVKSQVYYGLFGVFSVAVYTQGGWKGFALFYVVMIVLDYIAMKKSGELE